MSTKHPLAIWRESQVPPVTQAEFARDVKTSRWTINRIETGDRKPSRDLIARIAKETGGAVGFAELAEAA
jgi:transcriptional regulator with XRE-family HTH domain